MGVWPVGSHALQPRGTQLLLDSGAREQPNHGKAGALHAGGGFLSSP